MLQAFTKRFCLLTVVMLLSVVNALAQDVIEIGTVKQLEDFRDAVNNGDNYSGKTIKLTADLDLQGEEWTPIFWSCTGTTIFDGDGHTISNLTISSQPDLKKGVGLFSYLGGVTLKNLTLKNVNITANYKVGAFVGAEEGFAQIDNCHLDGATIITSVLKVNNEYDYAQHVGGIVGYLAASHTRSTSSSVTNCSVKNVTIQGYRDMGSIVGTLTIGKNTTPSEVSGCSAENVTLIQDNTINYKNYAEPSQTACNIHEIVGRPLGSNTIENNTFSNVTFEMGKDFSVAQIGNVKYATLAAAFEAAQANDKIELINDATIEGTGTIITVDKILTLDLKGYKVINKATAGRPFTIEQGGNLTIDGTAEGSGFEIPSENTNSLGFFRIDGEESILTVNGGSFTGNTANGAFFRVGDNAGATVNLTNLSAETNYRFVACGNYTWSELNVTGGTYKHNNKDVRNGGLVPAFWLAGFESVFDGVTITSQIGSCVDVVGYKPYTKGTFRNNSFKVQGTSEDQSWNNVALAVDTNGEVVVESGTYEGSRYGLYIFTSGGDVTINGGTFKGSEASIKSDFDDNTYGKYGWSSKVTITNGFFDGKLSTNGSENAAILVSGGVFTSEDPTEFVADGYEAVAKDNKWTVGKVVTGELNPETGASETAATYKVEAVVKDAAGTNIAEKDKQTITVSIVTGATENNVASDAAISKLNMETVVAKAITTAADDAKNINVSIAVVAKDETNEQTEEGTVVFEVHPEATVTVGEATPVKVKLANSDLKEDKEFTFTLNVDEKKFTDGTTVQVVHKSDDFDDETFYPTVSGGKVSITVSHFSTFLLSAAPDVVLANISAVGFATFSSDRAVDFTDIDAIHAYTAKVNGNKIAFTRIYKVPANTGLLLRNPNGASEVSVDVPVTENLEPLADGANDLVAVSKDKAKGELLDTEGENNEYKNYILNNVDGVGVGFFRPNGQSIAKGRAYLHVLVSEANAVQSFTNLFDGETTAIDSITTADEQTQDNVFYDLSGRRVSNPQRGLYIVNGKKVLVK